MLKLYYNNTRVFAYSDDMPDAMDPGFICMEGFVMEADAATGGNATTQSSGTPKTPTGQPSTAAPKVTFTDVDNAQLKNNMKTKSSIVMQRFVEWVRTNIMKFSDNFNKNHGKEVEWVKANMKLNEEIYNAINNGTFRPSVTNMPLYKISKDNCTEIKMADAVEKYIEPKKDEKDKPFNAETFIFETITKDETLKKTLSSIKEDPEKQASIWSNYILFGQSTAPENHTGKLTNEMWKNIYTDLIDTMPLIKSVCKTNSEDMNKAATRVKQKMSELESITTQKGEAVNADVDNQKKRLEELNKCIQTITKTYEITTFNALNTKFYKTTYNLYRDIVAGYKQQNLETRSSSTNSNESLTAKDMNENNEGK